MSAGFKSDNQRHLETLVPWVRQESPSNVHHFTLTTSNFLLSYYTHSPVAAPQLEQMRSVFPCTKGGRVNPSRLCSCPADLTDLALEATAAFVLDLNTGN